jgi:uncharacterized integral membrane protein (TIGR00697 family)
MTLALFMLWGAMISTVAIAGAWYARRYGRVDALVAAYVALTLIAGIVAGKTVAFDFGFTILFAPGGVLVFAVTFLVTDIVNERFGREETERMVLLALLAQAGLVAFTYLALHATPAPFFTNQAAFEAVLGTMPRIALAGLASFFLSEMLDARLFSWIRARTGDSHLWIRNAFSSLPSMALDSAAFVMLAFFGTMPLLPLIIGLAATKWLVGLMDIPFMYLARRILRGGATRA